MLAGISRPLTTSVGTSVMPRSLASFIEDSTDALVAGSAAQAVLAFKHSRGVLEKRRAAAHLGHANAVLRRVHRLRMDRRNGIVLEDNARLGEIGGKLIHVGLRLLAMRALKIGELDQFQ